MSLRTLRLETNDGTILPHRYTTMLYPLGEFALFSANIALLKLPFLASLFTFVLFIFPYTPQMDTISYEDYHVDPIGCFSPGIVTGIPENYVYLTIRGGPAPQSCLLERNCRPALQSSYQSANNAKITNAHRRVLFLFVFFHLKKEHCPTCGSTLKLPLLIK